MLAKRFVVLGKKLNEGEEISRVSWVAILLPMPTQSNALSSAIQNSVRDRLENSTVALNVISKTFVQKGCDSFLWTINAETEFL